MSDKKKKAQPGGDTGTATLDITHEEMPRSASETQAITPVIETVEDQISHEIQKFNFPEAAINSLKEQYGGLTITGPDDKVGYKAVKEAWGLVRSKRTGLEKKGLELRNNFKVITTAISKEEDRLVDLLTPLEEELHAKWKKIDDDKERAKKEAEEAEGRRLMARIEELQTMGMSFKDGFYQIGETISADVATLRAMPDDTFEKLKKAVSAKADELKKAAELEKQRKEQEAAELKRQQDDLKRQQEQMAEQQRQLQAQKDEMARQLREMRLTKLQALGMELEGDQVIKWESVRLYISPLIEMTADEFNHTVDITAEQIKELKNKAAQEQERQKQEQAEKERKEKYIATVLETAGLRYNYAQRLFEYIDDAKKIKVEWPEMIILDDAAIALIGQEIAYQVIIAKKEQEQREKVKQAEEQKSARLALNDKQRWEREMEQMNAQALRIVPAEYKTEKAKKRAEQFQTRLTDLINEFKP